MELADEASVDRCVQRLNGKLVPGSNPVSSMEKLQNTSSYIFHTVLTAIHNYCFSMNIYIFIFIIDNLILPFLLLFFPVLELCCEAVFNC